MNGCISLIVLSVKMILKEKKGDVLTFTTRINCHNSCQSTPEIASLQNVAISESKTDSQLIHPSTHIHHGRILFYYRIIKSDQRNIFE